MQWTNVNIKMSATQSTYELVQQFPRCLSQVCQAVKTAIDSLPTCQDPKVAKDLNSYKACLSKMEATAFNATDNLLSKSRVVATLKGEAVNPGTEDVLSAAKQQIQQLTRLVEAMERPELPLLSEADLSDLITW
nr:B2 protein [Macrobrachium rosenbergii nodavirus]AFH35953.1 B2 protein [Macrobrachium rosenbergii nodavirus]